MSADVLVAYATKSGSTKEVAEAIVETLKTTGLTVDMMPARDVRSLDGYQSIVLGAPLYMFRLVSDAHKFLKRHRKMLDLLPISIFALGPWHNKEDELKSAREQLDKELLKHPWLKPVDVTVFVGKFDPAKLTFPYTLIPAMKNMDPCDERDWEVIRDWASRVAARASGCVPA